MKFRQLFNPQSWNGPAVRTLFTILRQPSLLIPSLAVQDLSHVDISSLSKRGIKGIVLDKDNTITAPYSLSIHPRVEDSLHNLMSSFPDKVAILSNSAGTPDDKDFLEAEQIEAELGIPVIRHQEKKPGGLQETLDHFQLELLPAEIAMVGDRLLTDVVFGNLHGMYTIHVQLLTTENDNAMARVIRSFENLGLRIWNY